MNLAACLGACLGPVIVGAFSLNDPLGGWRNFYVRTYSGHVNIRVLT